jgi:hypothetical protein
MTIENKNVSDESEQVPTKVKILDLTGLCVIDTPEVFKVEWN